MDEAETKRVQRYVGIGLSYSNLLPEHMADFSDEQLHKIQRDVDAHFLVSLGLLEEYGSLPLNLDNTSLEVTDAYGAPFVFSYEKINDNLYILWDARHDLNGLFSLYGEAFETSGMHIPTRPQIFWNGIKKIKPKTLALEITRDHGQHTIDLFLNGRIGPEHLNHELVDDIMATFLFEDYATLVQLCERNSIEVKCVAPELHKYVEPESVFSEQSEHNKRMDAAISNKDLAEQAKLELEYTIELSKRMDTEIVPTVLELSQKGRTLLTIGSGHRPSLLELLK